MNAIAAALAVFLVMGVTDSIALGDKPDKAKTMSEAEIAKQAEADLYNVRIVSASYGLNCLGKPKLNSFGIPNQDKKYKSIKSDNALEAVKAKCEAKQQCNFQLTPEFMKEDPAPKCTKELEIIYRCYNIDSPHLVKFKDGEKIDIKCTAPGIDSETEEK